MTKPSVAAHRATWSRMLIYGLYPGLALILVLAVGLLKWQDATSREADIARNESVRAAKTSAVALLSFQFGTVDKDVEAARDRLTGQFRDTYTQVTNDVLIPNAKQQRVSAVANVAAAASESATHDHAVTLVFVDQTVTAAGSPPANTTTGIRVTLDKVGDRWLVSGWDEL